MSTEPSVARASTEVARGDTRHWDLSDLGDAGRRQLLAQVEAGGVLCLANLPLDVPGRYNWLLDPRWADPHRKNISYDASRGHVNAALGDDRVRRGVAALLTEFQRCARQLIDALAPGYGRA